MKGKKYTCEIFVADIWIEDGFELKDSNLRQAIEQLLPWAEYSEVVAVVTKTTNIKKMPEAP